MELIIPGACVPKGRPRTTFRDGRALTYTPERTRQYSDWARLVAKDEYNRQNVACIPYPRPVRVELEFCLERQASARPDLANLIVTILDALSGVAYDDDSQVVEIKATKVRDKQPRTHIKVEEIKDQRQGQ